MKKVLRIAGGILLVLIGIVGIILPIMPGWIFVVPGLVILADYFPAVKRLVDWAKRKLEEHDPRQKRPPSAKLEDHP